MNDVIKQNQKVVKIHPELDAARTLFSNKLSEELGVNHFPKFQADMILAKRIREDFMNFSISSIKNSGRHFEMFDIKWKK